MTAQALNAPYQCDMVVSSLYEDVAYATDGNYVFKTMDGGNNWAIVAEDSLETVLLGVCGPAVTHCTLDYAPSPASMLAIAAVTSPSSSSE